MREYETTFIIQPEISEEGSKAILERLDGVLESGGATRLMCEDLGKRKLAYEIRKFHKGHYHMLFFLDEGQIVPQLERALRMEESVLRFMTVQASEVVVDIEARIAEAKEAELAQAKRAEDKATREIEEAKARAEAERVAAEEAATAAAATEAAAEESAEATGEETTAETADEPAAEASADKEAAAPEAATEEAAAPEAAAEEATPEAAPEAAAEEPTDDAAEGKEEPKS